MNPMDPINNLFSNHCIDISHKRRPFGDPLPQSTDWRARYATAAEYRACAPRHVPTSTPADDLAAAATCDNTDVAAHLLEAHPIFARGEAGKEALLAAIRNLNPRMIEFLVGKGCTVDLGRLDSSTGTCFSTVVAERLRAIYIANHPDHNGGMTEEDARAAAVVWRGRQKATILALHGTCGVPIDFLFGRGDKSTSLMLAMMRLFFGVSRALIERFGANPATANPVGETALTLNMTYSDSSSQRIYAYNRAALRTYLARNKRGRDAGGSGASGARGRRGKGRGAGAGASGGVRLGGNVAAANARDEAVAPGCTCASGNSDMCPHVWYDDTDQPSTGTLLSFFNK